jgi:hypothetical protein
MSFLKEQYEDLERFIKKQQDERYEKIDTLDKRLFDLINEVRGKLPDDVEETLYDGMTPPFEEFRRSFKFSLSKKYGIRHLEKSSSPSDPELDSETKTMLDEFLPENKLKPNSKLDLEANTDLVVDTISVEEFVYHFDFDYKEVCENLQNIIDKYKLEINLKNYT